MFWKERILLLILFAKQLIGLRGGQIGAAAGSGVSLILKHSRRELGGGFGEAVKRMDMESILRIGATRMSQARDDEISRVAPCTALRLCKDTWHVCCLQGWREDQ